MYDEMKCEGLKFKVMTGIQTDVCVWKGEMVTIYDDVRVESLGNTSMWEFGSLGC